MADSDKNIAPLRAAPIDEDASVPSTIPESFGERYVTSNRQSGTTREVYNKRLFYDIDIPQGREEFTNLVNFNFAEKHLYGRVTRLFVPMVPSDVGGKIINIPGTENDGNFRALDFVSENFVELSYQFKKCRTAGQISNGDPYLSELKVYKAYEDPSMLYRRHRRTYYESIKSIFEDDDVYVINFEQFIVRLFPYLKEIARKQPFTFPAFVKSHYSSIATSGLAIEIADINPSHDRDKIAKFAHSRNWGFYLNACRSYGFMVDQFYPWRIVADIASSPMLRKATLKGLQSTDHILNTAYTTAPRLYYPTFVRMMLKLYNQVKRPYHEPIVCEKSNKIRISSHRPRDYTVDSLVGEFGSLYFFKLYCMIRFMEEESQYTDNEKLLLIDDCVELARQNEKYATSVFERILNKTFDYNGSLSYIKKKFDRIDNLPPGADG
jgi:hypothetical protein